MPYANKVGQSPLKKLSALALCVATSLICRQSILLVVDGIYRRIMSRMCISLIKSIDDVTFERKSEVIEAF